MIEQWSRVELRPKIMGRPWKEYTHFGEIGIVLRIDPKYPLYDVRLKNGDHYWAKEKELKVIREGVGDGTRTD